jgi:uncharacterized protein
VKFVLETGMNILIHGYDINMISITGINADHPDLKSGLIDEWDADNHLGIFRKSISIRTNGMIKNWLPQDKSEFNPNHFLGFAEDKPEIVLLGTGLQLSFPPQDCLSVLQQQNIGYEVMDTAAACRTFNVLVAEGRDVILAMLMIESS